MWVTLPAGDDSGFEAELSSAALSEDATGETERRAQVGLSSSSPSTVLDLMDGEQVSHAHCQILV
jgi:hypothetical protein